MPSTTLVFADAGADRGEVGAAYVSPSARLDDIATDGMEPTNRSRDPHFSFGHRFSSPACATRCIVQPCMGADGARARPRSSKPASSIRSRTSVLKIPQDWQKAQEAREAKV